MLLGMALDVPLDMKLLLFFRFLIISQKNETSGNSVRFESVVLQTNVRTEHGLLVDFRNSFANALRSAFTVRKKF